MEWISVHKYLPEPYDTVIWWDGRQCWFGHYDCATNERVYYFGNEQPADRLFEYWMPLPEPPPVDDDPQRAMTLKVMASHE